MLDDLGSILDQDSCPDLLIGTPYCYKFWGKKWFCSKFFVHVHIIRKVFKDPVRTAQ